MRAEDQQIQNFCNRIGYHFKNHDLLNIAITHPSVKRQKDSVKSAKTSLKSSLAENARNENSVNSSFGDNYERIEFLGDKILSLVIAEILLEKYVLEPEGMISRRHSALVCGSVLAEIAEEIGLSQILIMSEGERKLGGAFNKSNLENSLEALIAAIYLDGGFFVAKKFITEKWQNQLKQQEIFKKDPISCLQELTQEAYKQVPQYHLERKTGSAHNPTFIAKLIFAKKNWENLQKISKGREQNFNEQAFEQQKPEDFQNIDFLTKPSFAIDQNSKLVQLFATGNSKKEASRNVALAALTAIFHPQDKSF